MKEIIEELKANKQRLAGLQEQLLTWCRDKSNSLDERFQTWIDFASKHEYIYESRVPNIEIAPQYIQDHFDNKNFDRDRYATYDFWYLVDDCPEEEENEIKEWLIETNFGSYTLDW